jgi:uncharacterized protein (TIGR01777 family)
MPQLSGAIRPGEPLPNVHAIVHLAGESVAGLWTKKKKKRIAESRIEGTRRLVEAIERADPRPSVLVSASAVGYYGSPANDAEISEEAEKGEGFLAEVCIGWEREAERAEAFGVRVVRLRIGLVLGIEGGTLGAMLPAFNAGAGGRIGPGTQIWPWIHIDDLVSLIRRAIDEPSFTGVYNAVAPEPVPQSEFATTLASLLHRPAFLPAPSFVLRTLFGGFGEEMLVSRRVVPRRALEAGFTFAHPTLEPALRDLLAERS